MSEWLEASLMTRHGLGQEPRLYPFILSSYERVWIDTSVLLELLHRNGNRILVYSYSSPGVSQPQAIISQRNPWIGIGHGNSLTPNPTSIHLNASKPLSHPPRMIHQ